MKNQIIITADRGGFIKLQTPESQLRRYNHISKHSVSITFHFKQNNYFFFGYENGRVDIYTYNAQQLELQLFQTFNTVETMSVEEQMQNSMMKFYQPPYDRFAIISMCEENGMLTIANQQNDLFIYVLEQEDGLYEYKHRCQLPKFNSLYYRNHIFMFQFKSYRMILVNQVLFLLKSRIIKDENTNKVITQYYIIPICILHLSDYNYLGEFFERCEVTSAAIFKSNIHQLYDNQKEKELISLLKKHNIIYALFYAFRRKQKLTDQLESLFVSQLKIPKDKLINESKQQNNDTCQEQQLNTPNDTAECILIVGDSRGIIYRFDLITLEWIIANAQLKNKAQQQTTNIAESEQKKKIQETTKQDNKVNNVLESLFGHYAHLLRWFNEGKHESKSTEDQRYKITSISSFQCEMDRQIRELIGPFFLQLFYASLNAFLAQKTTYKIVGKSEEIYNYQSASTKTLANTVQSQARSLSGAASQEILFYLRAIIMQTSENKKQNSSQPDHYIRDKPSQKTYVKEYNTTMQCYEQSVHGNRKSWIRAISCFDSSGHNHIIPFNCISQLIQGGSCNNIGTVLCQTSWNDYLIFGGYEKFLTIYSVSSQKVIFKNYLVHDIVGVSLVDEHLLPEAQESNVQNELLQDTENYEDNEELEEYEEFNEEETEQENQAMKIEQSGFLVVDNEKYGKDFFDGL